MPPPPPPEPTELERQIRKLRLEVRKLRWTVIVCAIGIGLCVALREQAIIVLAVLALFAVMLVLVAGGARLLANGWDAVSMRWQRARWQAERNRPAPDDKKD